jgi:hypothetical protein
LCRFSDAGDDDANHALRRPASEKRQGTKSREVGHVDDPAGRLIEHFGKRVTVVRFPALAEQREMYRDAGAPLFPELKSMEAGRLHDRLARTFGRKNLFMDVDHIPAGVDFVDYLHSQVAACDVFLCRRHHSTASRSL